MLSPNEWRLVLLLGVANFFDRYDSGVLGFVLPMLQRDLHIGETELGTLLGLTRFGAIFVLGVTMIADRRGRQRLLLFSIAGFTVATLASALAVSAAQFTACQFVARFFVGAESLLSITVLTEELAAARRGMGISALSMFGAAGTGFAAFLFGFVSFFPAQWRSLYLLAAPGLLLVAWLRRQLRETERFERQRERQAQAANSRALWQPLRSCFSAYPGRLSSLSVAVLGFELALGPSFLFAAKHLQEVHHYTPAMVASLTVVGGSLATLLATYAGALSDRFGRRVVLTAMVLVAQSSTFAFYTCRGRTVAVLWAVMIFSTTTVVSIFQVLSAELFPTSYRSTASGARFAVSNLGAVIGLSLEPVLYGWLGSHARAISALSVVGLLGLVAPLTLPETAKLELEGIAPERVSEP